MIKPNTKFLVVDDFATSRKIVIKVLNDMGFQNIVEALDGQSAYEMLVEHSNKNEPFEFIISDWDMPNMLGIDFLKKCRAVATFKNVPFILITAESETDQIFDATASGATGYLVKPVHADNLKILVTRHLDKPIEYNFLKAAIIKK